MRIARQDFLHIVLGALFLGLAAALAISLTSKTSGDLLPIKPAENRPVASAVRTRLPVPQSLPDVRLTSFEQRPLFVESRRPALLIDTKPQMNLPPPPVRNNYALEGIILDAHLQLAIVRDIDSAKTVRVTKGDRIGSWTVARIQAGHVDLKSGSAIDQLEFDNKKSQTSTYLRSINSPPGSPF